MLIFRNLRNVLISIFLTSILLAEISAQDQPLEQSRQKLLDTIGAEWAAQGIFSAAKLGIPDLLDAGPKHFVELAGASGTKPESLYRLLRLLASRGIFVEEEGGFFSHSEQSRLLSKEHPLSLRSLTLFYGSLIHQSWDGLNASLQTGRPGFEENFGQPVFHYFKQNPKDFELFHKAMEEKSKAVIDSCLKCFDFSPYSKVFDIGGGKGHFLRALFEKYSSLNGILFELPEVIAQAEGEAFLQGGRCSFIAGDFFEQVPAGGDLYLLKSVIHDWEDSLAAIILGNCRSAMGNQARLMIVEPIISGKNAPDYAKLMDLLMMNVTGGKERTMEDFATLLERSGFEILDVVSTSTEFKIILAGPKS